MKMAKSIDSLELDRDLMVLQTAFQNKVPKEEGVDWKFSGIIEDISEEM